MAKRNDNKMSPQDAGKKGGEAPHKKRGQSNLDADIGDM